MSPAFVCPCCFLNRISSLRSSPQTSREFTEHSYIDDELPSTKSFYEEQENAINRGMKICSEISAAINSSSGNLSESLPMEFMVPERLVSKKKKSSNTLSVGTENHSLIAKQNEFNSETPSGSYYRVLNLAEQIDSLLNEQRKFLKELDLPITEDGGFRLESQKNPQSSNKETSDYSSNTNSIKIHTNNNSNLDQVILYACGDQKDCITRNRKVSNKFLNKPKNKSRGRITKPVVYFNEEPVKLPKATKWLPLQSGDLNMDLLLNNNVSVRMLFSPGCGVQCSSSTIGSHDDYFSMAASSVYVTATNSYSDAYREGLSHGIYTLAESVSSTSLQTTSSRELVQTELQH